MKLGNPEDRLETDGRRGPALLPPAKVLRILRPRAGQRFLDIGCGLGPFFFPVFEAMAGQGVFLAAEWDEERLRGFLSRLESYAEHPGYTRIEVVRMKPDRLPLPDCCADLVLVAQGYHKVGERATYLRELRRVLAPGGTLCLLDWNPPLGADDGFPLRVPEQVACRELAEAGFEWLVAHAGFARHWCLTARMAAA